MLSTLARWIWCAVLIFCSVGLWVLDYMTQDNSSVIYIIFAIAATLISPVRKTIAAIKWVREKKANETQNSIPSPPIIPPTPPLEEEKSP